MTKKVTKKFDLKNPIQFGDSKNVPSPIEDGKTFLDSLKLTYSLSAQFKDRTCEMAYFFFQDEALGKEIDIYIPYYGYQILALKNKNEFFGLQVYPHTNKAFRKEKECVDFLKKCESTKKVKVDIGVVVLGYLPEAGAWCSFFMKGTLNNAANKIISKLEKGECYFSIKASEIPGKNYLKIKVTVLDKNEVDNFEILEDVVLEKINLLLESGKEAEDDNDSTPEDAR